MNGQEAYKKAAEAAYTCCGDRLSGCCLNAALQIMLDELDNAQACAHAYGHDKGDCPEQCNGKCLNW